MVKPVVTYVIPVYNVEQFIERCVRSLMEQSYENIEYVFVDDCSPDRSMEVLRRVINDYPERKANVKMITHGVGLGSATSRNDGLDAATGDYVMFADSDDYVDRDYVETMVNHAEIGQCDIVYCDFYETYQDGDRLIRQWHATYRLYLFHVESCYARLNMEQDFSEKILVTCWATIRGWC